VKSPEQVGESTGLALVLGRGRGLEI